MNKTEHGSRRQIFSWILWTWGHDPFAVVITSFVFSDYFTNKVAKNAILGTAQWGWTVAIATVIVGIIAPFLGTLADVKGRYRFALGFFTLLTIIATALLWFIAPSSHYIYWALILYALGLIGFEVAMVYYNALLKRLAPKSHLGRLSGWCWASGYFGGIVALAISLFAFIQPHFLNHETAANIRIVPVFVALWMLIFCWPIFVSIKDEGNNLSRDQNAALMACSRLKHLFLNLRHYRIIIRFVVSRLFYIDSLNTVFSFAGILAGTIYHFSFSEVLYFGIAANIVAGIGTIIIAFIDDWLGPRFVIFWSIVILLIGIAVIYFSHSVMSFWIFSMCIAAVSGAIQASSRSYLSHITPKPLLNQMFGLYTLAGRTTAFVGPLIAGIFVYTLHDIRSAMIIMFILGIIGLLIFMTLPSSKNYTLDEAE